jgi:hypothetical protein
MGNKVPRFACRWCEHLTWASELGGAKRRRAVRAMTAYARLGGSANLFDELPPRPRSMQGRRYNALLDRAAAAIERLAVLQRPVDKGIPTDG